MQVNTRWFFIEYSMLLQRNINAGVDELAPIVVANLPDMLPLLDFNCTYMLLKSLYCVIFMLQKIYRCVSVAVIHDNHELLASSKRIYLQGSAQINMKQVEYFL